jgi:hypothetical protein
MTTTTVNLPADERTLLTVLREEIARRGGETEIEGRYGPPAVLKVTDGPAGRLPEHEGLVLMHASGYRDYGKTHGCHMTRLSYLCGVDEGQLWAVRVPGTITTVREAVRWIEPAEVRNARQAGRPVFRQGDVYIVFTSARYDGAGAEDLPEHHIWNPETRVLTHPQHQSRYFPTSVRFYGQKALEMGRSGRYGSGD